MTREWEDLFTQFDEQGKGFMKRDKFALAVRAGWQYPTEADVKKMLESADPPNTGKISKSSFLEQMAWIEKTNPMKPLKVADAFRAFDKEGEGLVNKVEISHVLVSMGDKLTTDEAEEFLKEAKLDADGMFDLEKFVKEQTDRD